MSATISEFKIDSLHGNRTITVPIEDNKIVLVGENGTGKSTVANLFYYFLTCQWNKIAEYEFQEISAIINREKISITKQQATSYLELMNPNVFNRKYPRNFWQRLEKIMAGQNLSQTLDDKEEIRAISTEVELPSRIIEEYIDAKLKQEDSIDNELKSTKEIINKYLDFQVLYLPTYRRIEQDLKAILPEIDRDEISFRQKRVTTRRKQLSYVEIIEFGMEDVEKTINSKMDELKENFRTGLNNLTGAYLSDVIRRIYQDVEVEKLQGLGSSTIDSIFSRIDEKVLPKQDQQNLKEFIVNIQNEHDIKHIANEDKIIAHFLLKLIDLQQDQKSKEQAVQKFIKVCNEYLVGKEIIYDNINFQININLEQDKSERDELEKIQMRMLSSGEKQIVSLFSHIYLSGITGYFVIIDEPELSLSVPWQKRFLPDIINHERCNGIVAVTHSPFIFDNELDIYTHSLTEYIR